MKKYVMLFMLSLICCPVWSQSNLGASTTIHESTDPERAAEVERKAQEIAGQEDMTAGSSGKEERTRVNEKSKKIRGHHKPKSASGTSGGAGHGRSGQDKGLSQPSPNTRSEPSDKSGNSGTAGSYGSENRVEDKEKRKPPKMPAE